MKNFITIVAILTMSTFSCYSIAEDGHDHDHKSERHESGHDKDHDHEKKKNGKNEKHDEHEHEEEEDGEHGHEKGHDSHEGHNDHDEHESENSHAHGHGHGEEAFGEGKAITAVFNEGEKFKLSSESEKLLGIETSPLDLAGGGKFKISNESLVRYQNHLGVFIKKDDWFVLIKLEKAQPKENYFIIESTELSKGVQIVNSGVPLLRVAHLQASGQGGKGHAH
ncbi:MAG: hypothetical protein H6626_12770 [Pseudobdellovibrionaceae bacterium]|nr:MAG: hypothetical protein H6626_12770 [Pseudobdellovibrionaceae bacterium]